jgi:hypothetical protein
MGRTSEAAPSRYHAIVFQPVNPTADFSCSERVLLPGEHTETEAWAAVRAALRGGRYIGGEVRFAENARKEDAENRSCFDS